MFEHFGIANDGQRRLAAQALKENFFAGDAAENEAQVGDEPVQVQRPRLHQLASAGGEHLITEIGAAGGGDGNFLQLFGGSGVACALAQQRSVAFDDAEDVVETMGDAASDLPDEFHFARLEGIIFAAAHLREIIDDHEPRGSAGVAEVAHGDFHVDQRLVFFVMLPATPRFSLGTRLGRVA